MKKLTMDDRLKGYLLAIISSIAYGLIPLFMLPLKAINLPVELILFYRFAISALFISGIILNTKGSLKITARELGLLIILGLLFSVSSDCLFIGYDLLSPGIASTLLFVYPIWVAVIMVFLYKEKISALTGLSLLLTVCGIFILSLKGEGFNLNLAGLSVCLMCALLYAIYIVVINRAKLNVSGMTVTFYSLLFSAAYFLGKVLWKGTFSVPRPGVFVTLTIFGLVTTVISIAALVYAIKLIGSTPTAILGGLDPLTAVVISVVMFGEKLTGNLVVGMVLILVGVTMIVVIDSRKEKKLSQK